MLNWTRFSSCLCLLLCAACTTAPAPLVTEYKPVERHLPSTLKRPCDKPWRKVGGPVVVADLIERGDVNELGLAKCSAQVDKIIKWDAKGNN